MATMVDLRLASTYLPAMVCAVKSALLAMLARVLVPRGGASSLALCVALDRLHLCQHPAYLHLNQCAFFDSNAVTAFVLGASVATHERARSAWVDGPSMLPDLLLVVWMCMALRRQALITPSKAGTSPPQWEAGLLIGLFLLLMSLRISASPSKEEDLPWAAVRALAFVSVVASATYTSQCDAPMALLMRAAPIFLSALMPALAFAMLLVFAALLRWHQHHSGATLTPSSLSSSAAPPASSCTPGQSVPVSDALVVTIGDEDGQTTTDMGEETFEEEQRRLREALARHKGGYVNSCEKKK